MSFVDKILDLVFPRLCISCKAPGAGVCDECLREGQRFREPYFGMQSFFNYENKAISNAIWRLKYHGEHDIGRVLGERLADLYGGPCEGVVVVPIPLSRERMRSRGFNQSEIIASGFATKLNLPTAAVLLRVKHSERQVKARDKDTRLSNIKDSFALREGVNIKDKHVLLIDDVITTGATVREAVRACRAGRPASIRALAIAH